MVLELQQMHQDLTISLERFFPVPRIVTYLRLGVRILSKELLDTLDDAWIYDHSSEFGLSIFFRQLQFRDLKL